MWRNIVCKMILKHATHVSIIIDYINCHPKFPYTPVTITGLLILQTAKLILDLDSQVNFLKSDVNVSVLINNLHSSKNSINKMKHFCSVQVVLYLCETCISACMYSPTTRKLFIVTLYYNPNLLITLLPVFHREQRSEQCCPTRALPADQGIYHPCSPMGMV